MNDTEFNLLDEPWVRVIDKSCNVIEVSLKDAILNAHEYRALGGELPGEVESLLFCLQTGIGVGIIAFIMGRYVERKKWTTQATQTTEEDNQKDPS